MPVIKRDWRAVAMGSYCPLEAAACGDDLIAIEGQHPCMAHRTCGTARIPSPVENAAQGFGGILNHSQVEPLRQVHQPVHIAEVPKNMDWNHRFYGFAGGRLHGPPVLQMGILGGQGMDLPIYPQLHVSGKQVPGLDVFSFQVANQLLPPEGRVLFQGKHASRDCWCPPGRDDTCGCRFKDRFGELPEGYDHKYVYSHLGYNLKATDMQAAVPERALHDDIRVPERTGHAIARIWATI